VAEIDTGADVVDTEWHQAGSKLKVQPRSLIVLRSPRETPPQPSGAATTHRT
jgi:glycogen operon protein